MKINDENEKDKESSPKSGVVLPPCGLAEDILNGLPADFVVSDENVTIPEEISEIPADNPPLPPSGLAEDILGKQEVKKQEKESKKTNEKETIAANTIKFVTFYLDNEEYGLPIVRVQEINRVVEITRVPNCPEHVRGIINLRGKVVPVIELKRRFHLGETKIDKNSRIVLVESGNKLIGLMVDKVSEVLNISPDRIENVPKEVLRISDNYISGIGKIDERMVILLELDQILEKDKISHDNI